MPTEIAVDTSPLSASAAGTTRRLKVVHVINTLGIGGAEMVLYRLLTNSDRFAFDMQVVALVHETPLGERLRRAGIKVHCLYMSTRFWSPSATLRLVRILRAEKPDLVQTWLTQSDLLGGIAARVAGVRRVLWNIRHSTLHPNLTSRRTRVLTRICALSAGCVPTGIVCCSEAGREEHVKLGYTSSKMVVIPNGIDTEQFRPDAESCLTVRKELGIPAGSFVVGAAARFHPAKNHFGLIRAAAEIASKRKDVHFVFCGAEVVMENEALGRRVIETGFGDRFHLLGERKDLPRIMAASNIFVSCSTFIEGFPNVVCEAMACGLPCVVTDVGDSARIVGDTGCVVPPGQPSAIAQAALQLCSTGHDSLRKLGRRAQARISENFSLSRMVGRYQELYAKAVAEPR